LKPLLAANKRPNIAYLLNERVEQLWDYRSEGWARKLCEEWRERRVTLGS
jgi:transposase